MEWRVEEDTILPKWFVITNDRVNFHTKTRISAEWLCDLLNETDHVKQQMDSISRSILCDNYGEC